jgi:hypothetical protein
MIHLSPNAENLLISLIGYYKNGIIFIDKDLLTNYNDQAIYEVSRTPFVNENINGNIYLTKCGISLISC